MGFFPDPYTINNGGQVPDYPFVYLRRHREADGRGHQDVVDEEVTSRQRASAYAAAWPPLGGPDVGQEGPEPLGRDQDQ